MLWSTRAASLNRGSIPRSSIRLLNYKNGGNCERRTSQTRSSFMTGRQSAPPRWRSSWGIHSQTRFSRELKRIQTEAIYQKRVFFIENLGFITPTEARRINFAEAGRFEQVHEEIYSTFGFELVPITPGSVLNRAAAIKQCVFPF
jgi:predicted ATPase